MHLGNAPESSLSSWAVNGGHVGGNLHADMISLRDDGVTKFV